VLFFIVAIVERDEFLVDDDRISMIVVSKRQTVVFGVMTPKEATGMFEKVDPSLDFPQGPKCLCRLGVTIITESDHFHDFVDSLDDEIEFHQVIFTVSFDTCPLSVPFKKIFDVVHRLSQVAT
jgi:hypothetical protein